MNNLNIINIINASVLQKLPDSFYKATKFATAIHDTQGKLITTIHTSCYNKFCRNMFLSEEGHARCVASNRQGEKIACNKISAYVYECHAGLTDVAAPVIINGTYIASVAAGQVLLKPITKDSERHIWKKMDGLPEKFKIIQMKALSSVRIVSENQIQGIAELLVSLANTIVDLVLTNIKEKKINLENIKLIDSIKYQAMLENEMFNAQIRLRETELNLLQAQVNPHFLYNTLDSIHWLAVLHGTNDIQQMILSLSALLRQSLEITSPVVPLEQEIKNVNNYLYIQKIRFGSLINYETEIDEEILGYPIPKLILQSLVENALKHGIEPKGKAGSIIITGKRGVDGTATIGVEDDGVGIDKNFLQMLIRMLLSEGNKPIQRLPEFKGHGIGLMNVHKRLIYYYDGFEGIQIYSTQGKGTRIHFKISSRISNEKFSQNK
ncbi:MAG: PocR ligand-binding domain-containing protein [Bacteroidetes bacterium]|nr:PocR ligand-binding domain-containing protein [Bacteroidota bacterium]